MIYDIDKHDYYFEIIKNRNGSYRWIFVDGQNKDTLAMSTDDLKKQECYKMILFLVGNNFPVFLNGKQVSLRDIIKNKN